jgi:hypothetical protein
MNIIRINLINYAYANSIASWEIKDGFSRQSLVSNRVKHNII